MQTLDDSLLVTLIDHIYDAATDPTHWSALTSALGRAFHAQFSLVFGFDPSKSKVLYGHSWGLPSELLTRYDRTYAALDVRMPAALRLATGSVVTDQSLIEPKRYHSSAIYNEFLRPLDLDHLLAALPENSNGAKVIVSLNRSRRLGPFNSVERTFLQRLVPHLQRALQVGAKLASAADAEQLSKGLMSQLHFGVLTLRNDAYIVDSNLVATRLLNAADALCRSNGRLVAKHRTDNDKLQAAIATMERFVTGRCNVEIRPVLISRPRAPPLHLLLAPMKRQETISGPTSPILTAFIYPQGTRPIVAASCLSALYGFTRAEARVAAKLVEGFDLREIANLLSVSIETVRTHAKRCMAKTQCESQSALLREILQGPAQSLSNTETWK